MTITLQSPGLQIMSFHPGIVKTELSREAVKGSGVPFESPTLPAAFAMWSNSPAARG